MTTRFDQTLAAIRKDPAGAKGFLICDAADADMGGGLPGMGPHLGPDGRPAGRFRSRAEFLAMVRALVEQGVVDLMLLSVSNLELLVRQGVFADGRCATAVRANDTTDIWGLRGGSYNATASRPFRTAAVEHMMHGRLGVAPGTPPILTDLGLYSVTFANDADRDSEALRVYREFRLEAERWSFRHFLEVFNPNVGFDKADRAEVGAFVNDCIVRAVAGVPEAARPSFLKIVYNGPAALEELVSYDPGIVVGILGGSAGTTRDTFELLRAAQRHGARLVLFGRKINLAEDPLALVTLMRAVVENEVEPKEAVRLYHDALAGASRRAARSLDQDLEISEPVLR
jgi:hypothetical protein